MTYGDYELLPLDAERDRVNGKTKPDSITSRWTQIATVLALLILPTTLQSQGRLEGAVGALRTNPVERLLEQREPLALTADQVAGLETIRARLDEQNEPLRAQLPDAPPSGGDRRSAMQQLRPVIEELMANNTSAMDEAMALLSEEQQEQARELLPGRRGPRGPGGPPGGKRLPR